MNKLYVTGGILLLLLAGIGGFLYMDNRTTDSPDNDTNETVQIDGEVVTMNLTDLEASPANPTIAPEDGIKFVNVQNFAVNVTFSRTYEGFTLSPGESKVVDISEIVYYDVVASDSSVEWRALSGQINVQSDA